MVRDDFTREAGSLFNRREPQVSDSAGVDEFWELEVVGDCVGVECSTLANRTNK